jgi:hypothetical protein
VDVWDILRLRPRRDDEVIRDRGWVPPQVLLPQVLLPQALLPQALLPQALLPVCVPAPAVAAAAVDAWAAAASVHVFPQSQVG